MVAVLPTAGADRRYDIDLLRCCAIVLIANSHLDTLYPIPQLGTGGALGNALFFMLSGYSLVLSDTVRRRSFREWYLRRIGRIYPSLLMSMLLIHVVFGSEWRQWRPADYASVFIWPVQSAWFIAALMVFYPVFFGVMRLGRPRAYHIVMAVLTIAYAAWYLNLQDLDHYTIEGPGYFKWTFYLLTMLFGGYLASRSPGGRGIPSVHPAVLCGLLGLYYFILFLVGRGFGNIQFLVHVLTVPILYCALGVAGSAAVRDRLQPHPFVRRAVSLVAGMTLEIYLLHGLVYSSRPVQSLPFPLNIAAFWVATVLAAAALERAADMIRRGAGGSAGAPC